MTFSKNKKEIKNELFIIKDFIESPDGKKIRPESYDKNKKFMSDVYPKLSGSVVDNLEYVLIKLHKGKMSLNGIAKEVIKRSSADNTDINKIDSKEENKMSKKNKPYVIGEEKGKGKKGKSTMDLEEVLKNLDDTLEMALEEKEKEDKESKKESSKEKKNETESEDNANISELEKVAESIKLALNDIDVDDDEEEDEEEDEDEDFFGDDDDEEEIIEEEDDFDDEDDDYDYYGRTPEYDQYEKDLKAFIEVQKTLEDLRDKLKASKDKLPKEVYREQKANIIAFKNKVDAERERLCKLNIQFFNDGTYNRINRHKYTPFKEGSKEWKQAIRAYDKVSCL